MSRPISVEIACPDGINHRSSVSERQCEPLAGDRVEVPRGVPNQGEATFDRPRAPPFERAGAAVT
jgi:hypothetical protein